MQKRELVYAVDLSGVVKTPGRSFSNPRYFSTTRRGFDKVIVVGNYPAIVSAYRALGMEVEQKDPGAVHFGLFEAEVAVPEKSEAEVRELAWNDLRKYVQGRVGRMPVNKAQCYELLGIDPDPGSSTGSDSE